MNRKINKNGKTLLIALLTLGMLVGGVASAYAVTTLDATAQFTAGVAGASELLDFNSGGSQIYDDWNLHIVTDDDLYLTAPGTTYVSGAMDLIGNLQIGNGNAAGTAETITLGSTGSSSIYDDWNLHIVTDDALFLDAPTMTTVSGDLTVGGGELYVTPVATSASTTEGTIYYDSDDDNLYVYANGAFVDLTLGAGTPITLDDGYNASAGASAIAVDAGSVTWALTNASDMIVNINSATSEFKLQDAGTDAWAWDSDATLDVTPIAIGSDLFDITRHNSATGGDIFDIDMGTAAVAGDVFDISWGGAGTGDVFAINMDNNLAGGAFVVTDGSGARTDALIDVTTDSTTGDVANFVITGATSGHGLNLDYSAIATGNGLDITYGTLAATGNAVDLNMGTNVAGDGVNVVTAGTTGSALDIASSGVFTDSLLNVATTGAWTGNLMDVDVGTAIATGNVLDVTFAGAAQTGNAIDLNMGTNLAGQAIDISLTGIRTDDGINIDDDSTGNTPVLDMNISGIRTGNAIDITYGTAAATENAIDLNMGTNVAGDALNIASSQTGGNAIDITSDSIFSNQLIDINTSGVWTGNLLDITTGAQAVTGNYIDINPGNAAQTGDVYHLAVPANAVALQNFVVTNAAISTTAGWLLDVDSTAAQTANWVDFDSTAAWTGNMFNVDNSGNAIWTGNVFDLNSGTGAATGDFLNLNIEAGSTAMQAIVIDNDAITATAGWGLYLDTALAWTADAVVLDSTGDAAWTGNYFQINGGTGAWTGDFFSIDGEGTIATGHIFDIESGNGANTGDLFNVNLEANDVAVQNMVVANASATTADGWLMDVDTAAAWTGDMFDFTSSAGIWTGDVFGIVTGGDGATGDIFDIQDEAGDVALQFLKYDQDAANTENGWLFDIDVNGVTTNEMFYVDDDTTQAGDGIVLDYAALTTGDVMNLIVSGVTRTSGTALTIDDASNATASTPTVDINVTDAAADFAALDINSTSVGANGVGSAIDITHSGVNAAGAATVFIADTGAQTTGNVVEISASGANNGQSALYIVSSGNLAAATDGAALEIEETGAAKATSYAVQISSTNNEALHVDAGEALFDEKVTITAGGLTVTAGGITVTAGDLLLSDGAFAAAIETVASATNMAIDSNVVTPTGTTTIATITGGVSGQLLTLIFTTSITVTDDDTATAANAINVAGTTTDFSATASDTLTLVNQGSYWVEVARSVND